MEDYAKAGAIPDDDFLLEVGVIPFPTHMLDHFRKLGLTVEVDDGTIVLRTPFYAASRGVPLTPEQAKLLVHFEKKIIKFSIKVLSHWHDGEFEEIQ